MLGVLHTVRCDRLSRRRNLQSRAGKPRDDRRFPCGSQGCGIGNDVRVHEFGLAGQRHEELQGIGPQRVERGLRSLIALFCAEAKPLYPVGCVAIVINLFGANLDRDFGDGFMGAVHSFGQSRQLISIKEILAHNREGPIAFGKFAELGVAPVGGGAEKDEAVGIVAGDVFESIEPQNGVTKFALGDVGEGDIFFENGRMAAPLGVAVAEEVFVVGEGEEFGGEGWGFGQG